MSEPNLLIHEKSPYLLQHAYNPVQWHPWNEAAFEKARKEDKPIFLSIGYSTCHWCHVMERESFEDEEVAEILNRAYIAVKVDREERPDIDHIYMTACQLLTGRGGWPLTVIMAADQRPFFAGTYFPKHDQRGQVGLLRILLAFEEKWNAERTALFAYGQQLTKEIEQVHSMSSQESEASEDVLTSAYESLKKSFDPIYGGFSEAPKFPTPHTLLFLLRYWKRNGDVYALEMAEKTLVKMAEGGIYDQVGYGFARYSTDAAWLVPHFEKMLYDNALLLIAYTEAWQSTKNPLFQRIVRELILYVKHEMMDENGGFFSAQDADSEGEEGKYYVFTHHEIMDLLGYEEGGLFCAYYGITPQGNFENQTNILHVAAGQKDLQHMDEETLKKRLDASRKKVLAARKLRREPHKDDKILTAWNALMIAALAKAGRVFNEPADVELAQKACQFIEENLYQDERLLARYREGEAAYPAYLDDHAFFLWALLELYASTYEAQYVEKAKRLADAMIALFMDSQNGGFYFAGLDTNEILVRNKEIYDGAIPSGNAVAIFALQRLGLLTDHAEYVNIAEHALYCFYDRVKQFPAGYTFFLIALGDYLKAPCRIVVAGRKQHPGTQAVISQIHERFLPQAVVMLHEEKENTKNSLLSLNNAYCMVNERPTVYICVEDRCLPPILNQEALAEALNRL